MLRSILSSPYRRNLSPSTIRRICTTPYRESWIDKVKGVFTGKKTEAPDMAKDATLLRFAEEIKRARKSKNSKQYAVGGSSTAKMSNDLEMQEAIIRYLGGVDPTGENIQTSHKQEAAKQCNCTLQDVENVFSKFKWAKAAHLKVAQLQREGKPLPKTTAEIHKLMESSPPGNTTTSRNAPCPCGSKKLYKRCCGKDTKST